MKKPIKEVVSLYTSEVHLYCPHCGEREDGFCVNPQGLEFECDSCKKSYSVHADADVEHV